MIAIGGDGAEGGWLARGMHSSVVFSSGAGSIVPCGAGLVLSAPQSGRFQVLVANLGPFATIVPVSILFGLAHLDNQNSGWMGLSNTVLFSVPTPMLE